MIFQATGDLRKVSLARSCPYANHRLHLRADPTIAARDTSRRRQLSRSYIACNGKIRYTEIFAMFGALCRHPDFFSDFGNTRQRVDRLRAAKRRQIKSGSRLGGMAERFKAPVLKTEFSPTCDFCLSENGIQSRIRTNRGASKSGNNVATSSCGVVCCHFAANRWQRSQDPTYTSAL
jgi:hypothetical protein